VAFVAADRARLRGDRGWRHRGRRQRREPRRGRLVAGHLGRLGPVVRIERAWLTQLCRHRRIDLGFLDIAGQFRWQYRRPDRQLDGPSVERHIHSPRASPVADEPTDPDNALGDANPTSPDHHAADDTAHDPNHSDDHTTPDHHPTANDDTAAADHDAAHVLVDM
jgi:hypothetical protein